MTMLMGDTASTDPAAPVYELAAVAGYVDGYVTYPTLLERWGGTHHVVSITTSVLYVADVLDVETGDAVASQAGPWVREMINRGVWRPCVYAQASRMALVQQSLAANGLARNEYRLWVADWDGEQYVPFGYDAKQFYGTESGSWDYSVVSDTFFGDPTKPKPKPTYKYQLYRAGAERLAVERYDYWRERQTTRLHPHRAWMLIRKHQCHLFMRRIELAVQWDIRNGVKDPWARRSRRFRHPRLKVRAAGRRVEPTL